MNDLRPFVVFAETVAQGSMSAAAARLGMTPSAVIQTIKALERQSGVTLLHRSTRKLALTEDGRRCYAHCVRLMDAWCAAADSLAQTRDAPAGELRIAAPLGFAPFIALAPVLSTWPQLRLRFLVSDDMVDLIDARVDDARVDLAIRVGKLADSVWTGKRLCELDTMLYAAPAYLERHGTPGHPRDLVEHHWIALERELEEAKAGAGHRDDDAPSLTLALHGAKRTKETVKVNVRIASRAQPTLHQLCEQGLGIVRLACVEAQAAVCRGVLVPVLPNWTFPMLPVTLVSPRKDGRPAKVRAAAALHAYFDTLPTTRIQALTGSEPREKQQDP